MMLSMTGFGAARAHAEPGVLSAEFRSVNSRYLDLSFRLPAEFSTFEPEARRFLQGKFRRGKLTASYRFQPVPGAVTHYGVNEPLLDLLEAECRNRGETPSMQQLLTVDGVIVSMPDDEAREALQAMFLQVTEEAAEALMADRLREGAALGEAIHTLHGELTASLQKVESEKDSVPVKYRERLHERLEELLGPQAAAIDPGRLEQETAIFADKADISEETARLAAHLQQLESILAGKGKGTPGRQLDFLAQEILREVNTIGSKARDLDIVREVLAMKNTVESLKEQAANVE